MHNSFCLKGRFGAFCLCWTLGLLLGTFAAAQADITLLSLMRPGALRRVSIVLLLLWCCLPLWITAWAVMIQHFEILLFLVFCRCFFSGFLLWLEVRSFGSAAWLLVPLSRFSDLLSLAVLCWYGLSCFQRQRKWELLFCHFITVTVVLIDYFAVSPFLAAL